MSSLGTPENLQPAHGYHYRVCNTWARGDTRHRRLWQQQGKREAAYELLAQVYNWFTEGFDTADLQEAKALEEFEG